MQRGEVWTLRDTGYASKARPVIVIQDEAAGVFDSIILCLLTTFDSENIPTRVLIEPDEANGLYKASYAMTDKIVTVDKALLGEHTGLSAQGTYNVSPSRLPRSSGLGRQRCHACLTGRKSSPYSRSPDGTASMSHCTRNPTRLRQALGLRLHVV